MKKIDIPPKACEFCGSEFHRRKFNCGKWESPSIFYRRRFCGWKCMGESKATRDSVDRERARGRYKAQMLVEAELCSKCGDTHDLVRHHKDENPSNNSLENIEVLCRPCHNTTHKLMRAGKMSCRICGNKHHSSGLCGKHYARLVAHGDPMKKCINNRTKVVAIVLD